MTGPKSIRSLERGLYVLQALQEQPISSLHDVYRFTGIPKPTLLRILHTLEQAGVVSRRLADGQYRISANQSHLTRKPDRYDRVAEAAAPVLDRLCRKISWPSDLMVPAGDHMEIREFEPRADPILNLFYARQNRYASELGLVGCGPSLPCLLPRKRTRTNPCTAAQIRENGRRPCGRSEAP